MSYGRPMIRDQGMMREARTGDGMLKFPAPVRVTSDSTPALPVGAITGGLYIRSGMTAGRNCATPTAAAIIAALPEMDVGDTLVFRIMVTTAFALTLTAGTDVTVTRGVVEAFTSATGVGGARDFLLTKTSATTVEIEGI
jgi:hypothetical protein